MAELDFERRLAAVLRADAERAVRPIDAVSIAVGATLSPRARRLRWPLRIALVLALLAVSAASALYLAGVLRNSRDPVVQDARPAVFDANGWLAGASVWAAEVEPITGLEASGRLHLVLGYGGPSASIREADQQRVFLASRLEAAAGELVLTLTADASGCRAGDVGRYAATTTHGGTRLQLRPIAEACAVRSAALARTWFRTLRLHSAGGTGLIDVFEPFLSVTLPAGEWRMAAFDGGFTMGDALRDVGLEVVKDAQGMTDPCREDGGRLISIPPGADAFTAYIDGLPGVDVLASDTTLGGYPARRIVATWERPDSCPPTRGPVAWRLNQPSLHRVGGGLTGRDVIYVIEAPGGATLVVSAGENGEAIETLDILPGLPPATGPP